MPLLLLFGQPLTGKSATALRVRKAAEARGIDTVVVDLELMGCVIKDLTENIGIVRTRLRQLVSQYLSKDRLIIVDHTNHTKSFRYELFCIARERKTTNCIVSCYTDKPLNEEELQSNQANTQKDGEAIWTYSRYLDMCSRFENLLIGAKADEPVFDASTNPDQILDYLYGAVKTAKAHNANASAVSNVVSSGTHCSQPVSREVLQRITKDIVAMIFNTQVSSGIIDVNLAVHESMASVAIPHKLVSIAQLHSLRRSYLQQPSANLSHLSEESAAHSFASYLNAHL